jgi:hypothetical protein
MYRPARVQNGMKAVVLLTVALGLASLALAATALGANGLNGKECPKKEPVEARHPALLTVKALHMFNQPIRTRCGDLARGPIWDLGWPGRPGYGLTMVIDAHDVTPVPGYGAHGPFYRLYTIKPGDLATIEWNGVSRTYRFVTHPFAKPQLLDNGSVNNKPIKNWRGEVVYFRCCWPRYTRYDYLYQRAVLVSERS